MNKILIIGENGMLGHVVKHYFEKENYDVYATSRKKESNFFFDAEKNIYEIENIINKINPDIIINCIGILNKKAEERKDLAILINSYLPHYLDELSKKYNFKFIHISTDCVFEGSLGNYAENSPKDAKSFYGKTKALGEIENDRSVTLRTSIIGPDKNSNGIGLFKWFMDSTDEVKGYTKAIWTGVTTIELAKQIKVTIDNNLTGLYHVINGEKIDKYSLLMLIKEVFNKEIIIIPDDSYVCDKSLIVKNEDFKFSVPSYKTMIEEMKDWIIENENM